MASDLEQRLCATSAEIALLLASVVEDIGGHEQQTAALQQTQAAELEAAQAELRAERLARETAERMQERFRYALFVYLQERDGPAGSRAPTPETLALIRTLIGDADGS